MTAFTAEETLARHKLKMGDDIGECYHFCAQFVFDLVLTWDQHETLFFNEGRVELLNSIDGLLAINIQRHFYNAVVMGLCRLTDREQVNGKSILSFSRLSSLCAAACGPDLLPMMTKLHSLSVQIRHARNNILAHNNYDVSARKVRAPSLGSRAEVASILQLMVEILNKVLLHYEESNLGLFPMGNNGAFSLLYYLYFGRKHVGEIKSRARAEGWKTLREVEAPSWLVLGKDERDRYGQWS